MVFAVNIFLLLVIGLAVLFLILPWTIMTASVFFIMFFMPQMYKDKPAVKSPGVVKTAKTEEGSKYKPLS